MNKLEIISETQAIKLIEWKSIPGTLNILNKSGIDALMIHLSITCKTSENRKTILLMTKDLIIITLNILRLYLNKNQREFIKQLLNSGDFELLIKNQCDLDQIENFIIDLKNTVNNRKELMKKNDSYNIGINYSIAYSTLVLENFITACLYVDYFEYVSLLFFYAKKAINYSFCLSSENIEDLLKSKISKYLS